MKKHKLPNRIIVSIENPGTRDEFLNVSKDEHAAAEQGVKKVSGVYILKEVIVIEGIAKVTPAKG